MRGRLAHGLLHTAVNSLHLQHLGFEIVGRGNVRYTNVGSGALQAAIVLILIDSSQAKLVDRDERALHFGSN